MKEIFIADLQNYIDKEIKIQVLLKEINFKQNRNKNKWQEMLVLDKTGETVIRAWAELMNDTYKNLVGKVVCVMGQVGYYQNRPDISIIGMEEVKEYDWADYVYMIDAKACEEYYQKIVGFINTVKDPGYKALLKEILNEPRIKRMASSVGGSLHHNYFGGLLVHTVETTTAAIQKVDNMAGSISLYGSEVNRDLVITGALLHDIGKLNAYSRFPNGERTARGMLVTSSVDSVLYATMFNLELAAEKQIKDLGPLDHILLTAESMDERGSYPKTLEAVIVNEANRDSVKLDGFNYAFHLEDRQMMSHKTTIYSSVNKTKIIREV